MKKKGLFFVAMLCASMTFAQSYGVLANGYMFYAGEPAGEFEGFQQYLAHVPVQAGDELQLYDYDNEAAWAVDLNTFSEAGFVRNGNKYTVSVSGCYDFYIKLKYNEDELYIGPGSNCGPGIDIHGGEKPYSGAAPARCPDVMLQAFYWNSYQEQKAGSATEVYGRTKWIDHLNGSNGSNATEIGQWFDLVWLPQMSKSSGGLGYHPTNYGSLDSDLGTKTKLTQLIETLHQNGARVVADIVINHADAQQGWCNFRTYNFGRYGSFTPDGSYICSTDEMNTSAPESACRGYAVGNPDDGYGPEANYASSRDWDHTNAEVRNMFKAYLKWMRYDVHVDGFRYDYCKGYHNSHINEYNTAAKAYFSVMEYWDGNPSELQAHLNDAGWNTLTFDFATKYTAFNNGIASDYYQGLKGAGLPGVNKSRYAVTFLDSHDSFLRDGNEFCGEGNSMTVCREKVLQCYAYLLSMPGVPCVFWPHWVTFKEEIKAMINARYKTGVHSESTVEDEAGEGYYKATIYGTNGSIRLLVGPSSGYNATPSGYTLAYRGTNYGVYYQMTTMRGNKDDNRQPIVVDEDTQDVETVKGEGVKGDKFIKDGQLYIRCGEQVYDVMGRIVK